MAGAETKNHQQIMRVLEGSADASHFPQGSAPQDQFPDPALGVQPVAGPRRAVFAGCDGPSTWREQTLTKAPRSPTAYATMS